MLYYYNGSMKVRHFAIWSPLSLLSLSDLQPALLRFAHSRCTLERDWGKIPLYDGMEPHRWGSLGMSANVCRRRGHSQTRSTEKEFCLNFGVGVCVTKSEGGLELRFSDNHCLHPSNIYSPGGLQICLQFRVPNQSHQATTEGSANPGTVSGLLVWDSHDPSTCRPSQEGMGGNGRSSLPPPVLFDSSYHQVQKPSRLKRPPLAWVKGELLARDPPTYPSPTDNSLVYRTQPPNMVSQASGIPGLGSVQTHAESEDSEGRCAPRQQRKR